MPVINLFGGVVGAVCRASSRLGPEEELPWTAVVAKTPLDAIVVEKKKDDDTVPIKDTASKECGFSSTLSATSRTIEIGQSPSVAFAGAPSRFGVNIPDCGDWRAPVPPFISLATGSDLVPLPFESLQAGSGDCARHV